MGACCMSDSRQRRLAATLAAYHIPLVAAWGLYSVALFGSMLVPGDSVPDLGFFGWDKLAHVLAFLGLALLTASAFTSHRRVLLLVAVWGLLFGVSTELAQSFAPGRIPSVGDAISNLAGTFAGVLMSWRFLLPK